MLGHGRSFPTLSHRKRPRKPILATGGVTTVIHEGGRFFRLHRFNASGTFSVTQGGKFEYLIVGGGGGAVTAGGGAGGFIEAELTLDAGVWAVIVGAGGAGALPNPNPRVAGAHGSGSEVFGRIALGGGASDRTDRSGRPGGSGSGAAASGLGLFLGGAALQPSAQTPGFGHPGGTLSEGTNSSPWPAAGGGGAGGPGGNTQSSVAGSGGPGRPSAIAGSTLQLAGGGAGGRWNTAATLASGGTGGGGNPGQNGGANTGGGGGGTLDGEANAPGGNGGSGLVMIRYRITQSEYLGGV